MKLLEMLNSSRQKVKLGLFVKNQNVCTKAYVFLILFIWDFFFFYLGFLSRTLTTRRTAWEGRGPSYSTLPLPLAHEHSDIYLQLCTWDDYHIFLITTLVFTRLLLDEIYHLIELLFDWFMINFEFCLFAC